MSLAAPLAPAPLPIRKPSRPLVLGIDFGTSNSAAALIGLAGTKERSQSPRGGVGGGTKAVFWAAARRAWAAAAGAGQGLARVAADATDRIAALIQSLTDR